MHHRAPGLQALRRQPGRDEYDLLVDVRSEHERYTERPYREKDHAHEFTIHLFPWMLHRRAHKREFPFCRPDRAPLSGSSPIGVQPSENVFPEIAQPATVLAFEFELRVSP